MQVRGSDGMDYGSMQGLSQTQSELINIPRKSSSLEDRLDCTKLRSLKIP